MDPLAHTVVGNIQIVINTVIMVFAVVIEVFALVHLIVQRPGAFTAINTLSKGVWLALIAASVVVTLITSILGPLSFIAITVAAIYLLDVRPALRDASDGP